VGKTGRWWRRKRSTIASRAASVSSARRASSTSRCEPDRAHGRFRAARDKPDLLEERNGAADTLRKLDFKLRGYTVTGSLLRLVSDRCNHSRMGVAEQHCAPGADKVQQPIAVRVEQILPSAAFDNERLSANGTKRPNRTVDAAHENLFSLPKNFAGTAAAVLSRRLSRTHRG